MKRLPKFSQQRSESEHAPRRAGRAAAASSRLPPHPRHRGDTRSELAGRNWIGRGWIKLDSTWRAAWPDWHQAPKGRVTGNSAETLSHFPARRGDEGGSPLDSALRGIKMGSGAEAAGAPGPGQLSCPAPRSRHGAKQGPQQGRLSQVRQPRRLAEACSVPGLGSALCSEGACRLAPMETACQPELMGMGLAASADGATDG